jgi:ProP effector
LQNGFKTYTLPDSRISYKNYKSKDFSMKKHELHPRTAVINKKQKILARKAKEHALLWLATTFPQAFDNRLCIRPLKLGIMEDILDHIEQASTAGISKSKLREAVVIFTRRIDYLVSLKSQEMRIDLQGNAVEAVTEEEAERAALKIRKRVEKSAKNARKIQNEKSTTSSPRRYTPIPASQIDDFSTATPTHYPTWGSPAQPPKPTAVVVKHKAARAYDPEAVARLKEKLGLSHQKVEME